MQSTLKNQKDCINKIQNKENFLILLKNIYVISKKNINLNFLHSSKIDQTKLQFKNMFLMDNFTSASLNFLNKDLSFDVGKKFIQIL
jgi:hypothetical protein